MKIEEYSVLLYLPDCPSLKEKRHRTQGLRDHFGRQPQIAVCESGEQDNPEKALWSFVLVANDQAAIDQSISRIDQYLNENVQGMVIDQQRTRL